MQQAEKSFNMRLFGKRLISARIEAGYDTSTALAQAIGVGKSTVTRWENGSNVPAYETLITLSKLLHVSCDYLLMDIPAEHRNAAEKYGLSNKALTMLEEMNSPKYTAPHWITQGYDRKNVAFIEALLTHPEINNLAELFLDLVDFEAYSKILHPPKNSVWSKEKLHLNIFEMLQLIGYIALPHDETIRYKRANIEKAMNGFTDTLLKNILPNPKIKALANEQIEVINQRLSKKDIPPLTHIELFDEEAENGKGNE